MSDKLNFIQSSQNILGYLPAIVVKYILENRKKGIINFQLPDKQTLKSVVMFADICGFTSVSERLTRLGPEGAEVIAFIINRYMELLAKAISRSGGDIFKFVGDSIVVIWPPHPDLESLCRQALHSALDIQSQLKETYMFQNIKLSVKIGLGVGEFSIIYVGGVFNRSEYLAIGSPLIQAFNCEHHATSGGQTLISSEIYSLIGQDYVCDRISDNCYLLKSIRYDRKKLYKLKLRADAQMITNNIPLSQFEELKQQLVTFIPAALIPYIIIDQEKWSAEIRKLTVMFINLAIDLSQIDTKQGLQEFQKIVITVQKSIYYFQGSLNKFFIDDRGSTLVVVFGFPPMSHQDDPIRAIRTAQTMKKELKVACSVGITTGNIYAGVVGTSGSRREYSVLGDQVNLAVRLMQYACKGNHIYIDCQTAQEASQKILIRFVQSIKFKGKDQEIKIFEPISEEEIKSLQMQSPLVFNLNHLRIHNPFFPKIDKPSPLTFLQENNDPIKIFATIDEYLKGQIDQAMIQMHGNYGSGKTFNMYLILNSVVKKLQQGSYKKWKYDESSQIFISNIEPGEIGIPFNGVRKIISQVYLAYMRRTNDQNILEKLDLSNSMEIDLLEQILELSEAKSILQDFPEKQKWEKNDQKKICKMVMDLMDLYQEDWKSTSPAIFCLDDLQYYDEGSLRVIKNLIKKSKRILIIMLIRDRSLDSGVQNDQLNLVEQFVSDMEDYIPDQQNFVYYLNGFEHGTDQNSQLKQFIEKVFKITNYTFESSRSATTIVGAIFKQQSRRLVQRRTLGVRSERKKVIATDGYKQTENDVLLYSYNKHYLKDHNTEKLFLHFIYLKTDSNPLTVINFINELIISKYIVIDALGTAILTDDFEETIYLDELFIPDCPLDKYRINTSIIDKITCLELLILKQASVIGDIFSLQMMLRINPFKNAIPSEKMLKLLQELVEKGILDIMEINEYNIYYRFLQYFMRESIYQKISYNQRRQLHRLVAEAIQDLPNEFEPEENYERLKLQIHWTLSEQRWTFEDLYKEVEQDSEQQELEFKDIITEFSHKAKRSLIVKSIQSIISKNQDNSRQVIIKGTLEKKSDRNVTWAPRFCVMTNKDFSYYYSRKDEENKIEPLGRIPLQYIYSVIALNEREKGNKENVFQISAKGWLKKMKEMKERQFYFAAENVDLLEEWIIYLEFTRAKASYDDFVQNFGKIQFPIGTVMDHYDLSIKWDINNLMQTKITCYENIKQHGSLSLKQARHSSRISKIISTFQAKMEQQQEDSVEEYNLYDHDLIKDRLNQFIQKSMLLFYSQLFEMSLQKKKENYRAFGQNTKFMASCHPYFKVNQELNKKKSDSNLFYHKNNLEFHKKKQNDSKNLISMIKIARRRRRRKFKLK